MASGEWEVQALRVLRGPSTCACTCGMPMPMWHAHAHVACPCTSSAARTSSTSISRPRSLAFCLSHAVMLPHAPRPRLVGFSFVGLSASTAASTASSPSSRCWPACMHACMHACMYACAHVACMVVRTYASMHACMHAAPADLADPPARRTSQSGRHPAHAHARMHAHVHVHMHAITRQADFSNRSSPSTRVGVGSGSRCAASPREATWGK